ncbi:MAG: DedA family protein [Silicimonas sp.]|nr:DedA family protein [Silicimonas sp.]
MSETADKNVARNPGTDAPDWMERLANHRAGLAALSFGESTVVPIPLEALVVPLMVGHPKRALVIAVWIWLGCLVGASLFYFVGLWLADPVVLPAIEWLGLNDDFEEMQDRLSGDSLFWVVFTVSLLPAPMQLATLGTGAVDGNFLVFISAIALSRGIRYFGLAILAQLIGERIANMNLPKRILIPALIAAFLVGWGIFQLI